jgi:hypothetical protein
MANDKYTEYYMNGAKVDKKAVTARKDKKLASTTVITKKYYTAPLNDSEKAKKQQDAANASKFWRERADNAEDMRIKYG